MQARQRLTLDDGSRSRVRVSSAELQHLLEKLRMTAAILLEVCHFYDAYALADYRRARDIIAATNLLPEEPGAKTKLEHWPRVLSLLWTEAPSPLVQSIMPKLLVRTAIALKECAWRERVNNAAVPLEPYKSRVRRRAVQGQEAGAPKRRNRDGPVPTRLSLFAWNRSVCCNTRSTLMHLIPSPHPQFQIRALNDVTDDLNFKHFMGQAVPWEPEAKSFTQLINDAAFAVDDLRLAE